MVSLNQNLILIICQLLRQFFLGYLYLTKFHTKILYAFFVFAIKYRDSVPRVLWDYFLVNIATESQSHSNFAPNEFTQLNND